MSRHDVGLLESFEEAGIIGNFLLGVRAQCTLQDKTVLHLYPLKVSTLLKKWPEAGSRKRAILPVNKALKTITDKNLVQCIQRLCTKLESSGFSPFYRLRRSRLALKAPFEIALTPGAIANLGCQDITTPVDPPITTKPNPIPGPRRPSGKEIPHSLCLPHHWRPLCRIVLRYRDLSLERPSQADDHKIGQFSPHRTHLRPNLDASDRQHGYHFRRRPNLAPDGEPALSFTGCEFRFVGCNRRRAICPLRRRSPEKGESG